MKNTIRLRLQLRFVLLSLAALLIMQIAVVTFSICRSYRQMTLRADRIIRLTDSEPDSPEISDARYFKVSADLIKRTFETDLEHTSLVTRKTAIEYAKKIIDKKTDKGYIDTYRYLVHRDKDKIYITFLARATVLETFKSNSASLILISLAGILIMTVILSAVSGTVVAPLVNNRQKQKEFITSASHELKTPLTVINADAQLLESEIGENEWVSDILKQTRYMTEMTHKLVYLARAEEQNDKLVKLDFPVSDLAEDICESYRAVAASCGKTFDTDISTGISYHGDEKAIRELMTALLDNAFKYSPERGSIFAALSKEGRAIRFTVENTVADIDAKHIESFTDRFYRAAGSSDVKGFGIGLSVARAVAENHNGKLTIEMSDKDRIKISAVLK